VDDLLNEDKNIRTRISDATAILHNLVYDEQTTSTTTTTTFGVIGAQIVGKILFGLPI